MLVSSYDIYLGKVLMLNKRNASSNNHPNNITFNLWIRYQAKCILGAESRSYENEETCIKKHNMLLPAKTNTVIDLVHIETHPREWQGFLETMIPDYLIEKEVWWKERDGCIEFSDHTGDVESNIETKHFRSTTMCGIEISLKYGWGVTNHIYQQSQ